MFVRNYDSHVYAPTEYVGLRANGKYWCPYFVKYVSWFLVAGIVISANVVVILHGMPSGMIKTYLWLTTLLSSVFISIIVIAPVRIFMSSLLNWVFIKKKPILRSRKIRPSLLANADDPEKKERVLKYRQFNAHLYAPTALDKLENRLEDIKYNIELRNLTVDLTIHVLFMLGIVNIVQMSRTGTEYHSTEIVKNLVLRGTYTKSIPFSEVTTYEKFLKYLNETFLPALLLNHTEFAGKPERGRRWVQDFNGYTSLPMDVKKRQILDDFANLEQDKKRDGFDVFQAGWTKSLNLKLLGKPRLRQVRVKTGTCKQLRDLEGRNLECAADLTPFNVERGKFTLRWEPGPPKGLTTSQATPWTYQSAWDSQSLPTFAKYTNYPGGGYILGLARDITDARIVLEFLDAFQWVDMRTRAVFIEFTVYCVNTNLFNVVTLIVEKTASGYIIPSYKIHTRQFMFMVRELEVLFIFMSFLFVCSLIFFMVREGMRIHRTTLVPYLKRGFSWMDVVFILLELVNIIFLFCRSYYITRLLKNLEKSNNNEFVSFIYAAYWDNCFIYIKAILICLSFFKLFRLLTFRAVLYQMQTILSHCCKYFITLFAKQMVMIFAFAFLINLILANYSYGFRTFDASVITPISQAVALDDNFEFGVFTNFPCYLGPLLFGLFIVVVIILFNNVFIAIVCLYLSQIQKVSLLDKYNILEYIKYVLLSGKQSDILHLKERNRFREQTSDPNVMRLTGGGNRLTKKIKKSKKICLKKRLKKDDCGEEKTMKTRCSDFITKKLYDTTEYLDLAEERAIGMKYLMLSFTSEKEKVRRCARENALKALFCSFTAAGLKEVKDSHGRYFFVVDKSASVLYDAARFLQMKKVIEDKAREEGWVEDDEGNLGERSEAKDKLSSLNRKLCLLIRKRKL